MTLFLWHMTAYLVAILALWPLGFGRQHEPTLRWWAERPVWILVPAAMLLALVTVFGRFETRGHQRLSGPAGRATVGRTRKPGVSPAGRPRRYEADR